MLTHCPIAKNTQTALYRIAPVLHANLKENMDSLTLGGGTVLASRWNHRISTDLDFFLWHENKDNTEEILTGLKTDLTEKKGYTLNKDHHNRFEIQVDTTAVSIMIYAPGKINQITQRETQTQIGLENSAGILDKKLKNRMLKYGIYTIRDVFDLYVAQQKEPQAFNRVIAENATQLPRLIKEIKKRSSHPIVQHEPPLRALTSRNIADNPYHHAHRMLKKIAEKKFNHETHEL